MGLIAFLTLSFLIWIGSHLLLALRSMRKLNEYSDLIVLLRGLFLILENIRNTVDFKNLCLVVIATAIYNTLLF